MATEIRPVQGELSSGVHEMEKFIPVFTVMKNNSILKNIFLIDRPPSQSNSPRNSSAESEEVLVVGRHPDCSIILEHPSISRFHLRIHSIPSLQSLSVVDLSSVHGTWVSGKKVEPGVPMELHEGDLLQLGGSTRAYRLHWVPLSRAYDLKSPFVPPLGELESMDERQVEPQPHQDDDGLHLPEDETKTEGDYFEGLDLLFSDMNMKSPTNQLSAYAPPMLEDTKRPFYFEEDVENKSYFQENFQPREIAEIQPVWEIGEENDYLESALLTYSDDMNSSYVPAFEKPESVEEVQCPILVEDGLSLSLQDIQTETPGDCCDGLDLLVADIYKMISPDKKLTPLASLEIKSPSSFVEDAENKISFMETLQQSETAKMKPALQHDKVDSELPVELASADVQMLPQVGYVESPPPASHLSSNCELQVGFASADVQMFPQAEYVESPPPASHLSSKCDLQVDFVSADVHTSPLTEDVQSPPVASHLGPGSSIWKRRGKSASVQVQTGNSRKNYTKAYNNMEMELESNESEGLFVEREDLVEEVRVKSASVEIQTGRSRENYTKANTNMEMELKSNESFRSREHLEGGLFESEDLVEEVVYTPDKENKAPETLLLYRLLKQQRGEKIKHELNLNSLLSHTDEDCEEAFTPDKENMTPKTHLLRSIKKMENLDEINHPKLYRSSPLKNVGPNTCKEVCMPVLSEIRNHFREALQEKICNYSGSGSLAKSGADILKVREHRMPFQSQLENSNKTASGAVDTEIALGGFASAGNMQIRESTYPFNNSSKGEIKMWTMVVDTASLLNKESRKALQLMQGLHGTNLIIPRIVIRELDRMNKHYYLFRRKTEVSSALQWIKDCMIDTKWWIHVQSSVEDAEPVAPTPRSWASPQMCSEEKDKFSPFGSFRDIVTPTTEDHVLECALFFRKTRHNGQLVLLSDDVSLKIKAMAEGLLCETAEEFRQSVVNPFSERFLWTDSSPRGPTWSCRDDVVLREKYSNIPSRKQLKLGGEAAKGLKLILLHNSQFRQIRTAAK